MHLIIHIGGQFEAYYRLELNGDELAYYKFYRGSDDQPEILHPSDEQWKRFWTFMRECDHWAERYERPYMINGTLWLAHIEDGELSIFSSGCNDFPENFQSFLKEVRLLIGGREFQ